VVAEKGRLPSEVLESIERNALLNSLRHSGRAQAGAVINRVIAEFPELRTSAKEVAKAVQARVKDVNSMTLQKQQDLLQKRYPGVEEVGEKKEGRLGLPPLPNASKGAVTLRLPPEPSGFMHIGHGMAFTINDVYRQTYSGKLWLRFEDTNPRRVEKRYYENFREGIRWLGIGWDYEKSVSGDLDSVYGYGQRLLAQGNAYACGCEESRVKKLRFAGEACEHREQSVEKNLLVWSDMLSRRYGEGEYVIRMRGDMKSLDYSMRDPNIFRVIEHEHPLTGSRFIVWPTYDFEVVVEDELCSVTHVLRSSEFHLDLQALLRKFLQLRPVTVVQFSRFNFKGTPVAKRLLRPLVDEGLVTGWDDPRMPTIEGVRRRGISPEAIRDFTLQVGYTKTEHEYDWSLLFAVNRKLLDAKTKRVYFVPRPLPLTVDGAPRKRVSIRFHPEKELGERAISVSNTFRVPSDDVLSMKEGETFRLMELYNVKLLEKSSKGARGAYLSDELLAGTKKLQWTTDESRRIEVLEPGPLFDEDGKFNRESLRRTEGEVEQSFEDLDRGEVVQFPRYGFCRVDSDDVCVLAHK